MIMIKNDLERIKEGFNSILNNSALLEKDEKILIISDQSTKYLGNILKEQCKYFTHSISHITIPAFLNHGEPVSMEIEKQMLSSTTIFGLTTKSMAHTKSRLKASENGIKYLSLPYYSEDVLKDKSLLVDFREFIKKSENLALIFSRGKEVHITTKNGTNLKFSIENRLGNPAPGCCYKRGVIASPPDSETNVAIVENSTNGKLIVDGSIPIEGFGLLEKPIRIDFENGYAISFAGEKSNLLREKFESANNKKSMIAAEFGVGLNPKAKLIGNMLQDEGALGTIHIGIGANSTIGGLNHVNFHLDHIIRNPTFFVDNKCIMENGKFIIKI